MNIVFWRQILAAETVSAAVEVFPLLGISLLPVLLYQLQKTVSRCSNGAPLRFSKPLSLLLCPINTMTADIPPSELHIFCTSPRQEW